METEADYEQLMLPQSESPPLDLHPKLKRLKKKSIEDSERPKPESKNVKSDAHLLRLEEDLERENEPDGLDPLSWEADQSATAKRVLEFDDLVKGLDETEDGLFGNDADFQSENGGKKKRPSTDDFAHKKETKKKKKSAKSVNSDEKLKISKRKEKEEKKAHLAQLAEFQRVMRERKGVGFKAVPMVEKPISSVLEKIRQRKMEVSKKAMASKSLQCNYFLMEAALDDDPEENDYVFEVSHRRPEKAVSAEPISEPSAADSYQSASLVNTISEPCPSNEQTSFQMHLAEGTTKAFRPPVDDTQDLFSDSQTINTQDDQSNEESGSPAEDIAPSLPSLNLKFDSALPDDISSDEEESDKENVVPRPPPLCKGNSSPMGDPVKAFVDEEALEDDSDNDLLHLEDENEGDDADMEDIHDYIATDCKEKAVDHERRDELHQMWLQQQDEAGTENLLQKLKYGTNHRELSLLEDEDDGQKEDEEDDSDNEDTGDLFPTSSARVSTKKLKQMIPQMFTEKDDGFVSSDDEETERKLSKQRLLQKTELKEHSKFLSPAEDEKSREVFGRIKKLNVVPEAKTKPKTSSYLDSLLMKGGSNNSLKLKSSFLRRASSHPMTSSRRHGTNTGRSYIFGRDDSSSRSSISLAEESPDLSQKDSQAKRSASAKFVSSQAKRSTQNTETRGETLSGTSLFEILKRSSIQSGHDARDDEVDHQAVFAAFKSVKKSIKIDRRS